MFVEKNLNYKNLKLIILFLILIVSFWRSPYIFFNGRFIGEEATHHFLYALENSFLKNLFYYDVFAGYISVSPLSTLTTEMFVRLFVFRKVGDVFFI